MGFAERMECSTKNLQECARAREHCLTEVSTNTQQLLSEARSFMDRVSKEVKDQAGKVRATLAVNLRERQDHVRAMRHHFHGDLGKMREHLTTMLSEDSRTRHDKVIELKLAFQGAQAGLVADLREAARIWRERQGPGQSAPQAEPVVLAVPHVQVSADEPVHDRDHVVELNVIGHWSTPAVAGEDFGATRNHEHRAGSEGGEFS